MTEKEIEYIIKHVSENVIDALLDNLEAMFVPQEYLDSESEKESSDVSFSAVDDILSNMNSISTEEELLLDLAQSMTRLSFYEAKENYRECAKLKKKITSIQTKLNDI
tara:strand:+ start:162 stop:485 length:324 start_codon:yes stop_codon:yes gene_type:complete